jgi:hypothetical protein
LATIEQAAAHIDIAVKRYRELVARKVIPTFPRGQIDLDLVRFAYIRNLRETAANRGNEKQRLDAARADQVEFDLAIKRGEHVPLSMLAPFMAKVITDIRSRFLGMSVKLAPQVIGHDRIANVENVIKDEILSALGELSCESFDNHLAVDGAISAAAETLDQPVGRKKPPPKRRSKRRARPVAN